MHVQNCSGCARRRAVIRKNLGSILDTAASLFTGAMSEGGGGSAPMAPSNQNTVSPNIQVSPQISPIFQQSFQPSNSPMNAGTSQSLPGMPQSGGGFMPVATPQTNIPMPGNVTGASPWAKYVPWAVGGLVALFAIKTFGEKRGRNAT